MPDDDLEFEDEQKSELDQPTPRSWSRLKSRFPKLHGHHSPNDSRDGGIRLEDGAISDFLYTTGQAPERPQLLPPHIDISAAKAADSQSQDYEKFEFSKPPRASGLKVTFVSSPPEIIGIGGEDAADPAIWISQLRRQNMHLSAAQVSTDQGGSSKLASFPSYGTVTSQDSQQPPWVQPSKSTHLQGSSSRKSDELLFSDIGHSDFSKELEVAPRKDLRQMRADEGKALLSASLRPARAFRRKPVGGSDSESSSRSDSPATSKQTSPPPSRGSDEDIYQVSQYPQALLYPHLQAAHPTSGQVWNASMPRPSNPGSNSDSRENLTKAKASDQLHLSSDTSPPRRMSPFPTSHPAAVRNRSQTLPPYKTAADEIEATSNERLASSVNSRSRSFSNQSLHSTNNEQCIFRSYLQGFEICQSSGFSNNYVNTKDTLPWNRVHVFAIPSNEDKKARKRIIAFDGKSSLMDELDDTPDFRPGMSNQFSITLIRKQNSYSGISLSPSSRDEHLRVRLQQVQSMLKSSTLQTYIFHNKSNFEMFQAAITGHTVKFDAIVESFSISRRRMITSAHRNHETQHARVQILHGNDKIHLVGFFSSYSLAACLKVELRSFDVFEASETKDGMFRIKIVDAKFSLPQDKTAEPPQFVALDLLEPTSEHDDILLVFGNENMRDDFAAALPAPITGPRKFTMRRRI